MSGVSNSLGAETRVTYRRRFPAGLAIGDYADLSTFPVVPENEIQPYVQEAINEIHFITGDAKTNEFAKLRAKYGHPEPYKLKYIEIGNEDFFVSTRNGLFVLVTDKPITGGRHVSIFQLRLIQHTNKFSLKLCQISMEGTQ